MSESDVLQSAVRVPTPPPGASYSPAAASRKRSPPSRSPSPNRRRSPPGDSLRDGPHVPNVDAEHADDRERQLAERVREHEKREAARKPMTEEQKQASAKAEYEKLLNMRSGGTYIPPARLRALQAQITDKTSKEYQRMAWEALKKSINGLINKVNVSNIKFIVPELFAENLVRGRGLFCRSIMKAQAASLPFTPIYAAMAAIVNTKLPQVGDLLLTRLIIQFRKAFKRNDKAVCISSTTFIAHLCNQQVAHEMLAAQILLLLLHKPTDDSVEIAVGLTREVGQHLEEMNAPIALAVFDQFRNILHEADIDKRVQYMIEVLFQVRKDRYKDNPAIKEELDLVEEEDQITHRAGLDDELETQDTLNIFKYDAEWEEHEEAYRKLKAEILGEESDEEDEERSDESEEEESDTEEVQMDIKDQSNTDLVNLRRTIYLTIMSSIDFEECCHKLMKINLPAGLEHELPSMIIECCSQERTYSKFYGLIGERFAKINRLWSDLFEAAFAKYYDTIHRYETNKLRNIAQFFGHLISNDAIGWHVLSVVHLNEEETTSSSRIFIKILFQNLAENLGLPGLQARFRDDILRPSFEGLFPTENPRHTRFSVNYFTSIGMGVLTEDMRENLKNLPRPTVPALPARAASRTPSRTPSDRSRSMCSTCTGSPHSRRAAVVPTLAPSLLLPGAAATHLHGLGPQSVAVVTYQTVDPEPPQDAPAPDPFPDPSPDPSPVHRPSAVEHVPAPTTHEARVAVPIELVARLLGLSHRRVEAKALLAGETAATLDQFPGLSHLHLVVDQRLEVEDIQLNLFHPPRRRRDATDSVSRSRSPPPRRRAESRGRSYSRTPPRRR
ncbi:MIF4-like type 1/2/3 [Penicillium chrysogenum]|nr:MIF4-like type 1/2/3 [Penicillium chrysogenum]